MATSKNATYRIEGITKTHTSPLVFTHAVVGEYDHKRAFKLAVGHRVEPACWDYVYIECLANENERAQEFIATYPTQDTYIAFIREVMMLSVMGRERDRTIEVLYWATTAAEAQKVLEEWVDREYRNVRIVPVQRVSE